MKQANLSPAYGRDYSSAVEVEKHWNENRDFVIHIGARKTYVNKLQSDGLKEEGFTSVKIRYNNLKKFLTINL